MGPSIEDIKASIASHGVHFVKLFFTDIHGISKNLELPVSQLDKILENEIMIDGSSIAGFSQIEDSDLYLYPDLTTFNILPSVITKYPTALFVCDIYTADGSSYAGDPRAVIKRALNNMQNLGFSAFNVGCELEFFLFKDNAANLTEKSDHTAYVDNLAGGDYYEIFREDVSVALEELGFTIEALHHEVGNSQHEINFEFADALTTCDRVQIFKYVVKAIAHNYGFTATFMPKPIFGEAGSGMHCNMSLFKGSNNVFFDKETDNQLSALAIQFLTGILAHAKGFTAICNPLVNSYKRLVPGYEAPVYVAWSCHNRSALIRVPSSRGRATRLELRSTDPATNPYLATAVLLNSGLDGIVNSMVPVEETHVNLFECSNAELKEMGIEYLPTSLAIALSHMELDKVVVDTLGEHIYTSYTKLKHAEYEDYSRHVSQWEVDKYLRKF